MKALTIIQPWATLIASGHKMNETRSWKTNYRGEVLIHAGKNPESTLTIRMVHISRKLESHRITSRTCQEDQSSEKQPS